MRLRVFFAAILIAVLPTLPSLASEPVIELFTSQGCNSCPTADAVLGRLIKRSDVLAFSLHVDYWDYLGWKDTLASADNTIRQRAYARAAGRRTIYTPEVVMGGELRVVGSDQGAVEAAIAKAKKLTKDPIAIGFTHDNMDYVTVDVAGSDIVCGGAAVLLFRYDTRHEVQIERGKNAGSKLAYHNVVGEVRRLDTWRGEPLQIMRAVQDLKAGQRDGCAIVIQREHDGPIIVAAKISLAD